MSSRVSEQIRPLTAVTSPLYKSGLIDSIYNAESAVFSQTKLAITPQTPSTRINSATKQRRFHFRACSLDSPTAPHPDLSCILKKDLIKSSQSRKRKKFTNNEIFKLREIRCKALNSLMGACRTIKPSKKFNKSIDKEQKALSEWSKKMESVTENLMKLAEFKQEYIESLYYYNKSSNEDILSDVLKLKSRKDQAMVIVKRKHKKRASSEFG